MPVGALVRLMDMGVEPYQLVGSTFAVVSQRLVRVWTGERFAGRRPIGSCLQMDSALRHAILERAAPDTMQDALQQQSGYRSLRDAANDLVAAGLTTTDEVDRILGPVT